MARISVEAASAFGTGENGTDGPPGGLTTFIQMQRDAQVRACLTTKRLFVLSGDIVVTPANDTPQAREVALAVNAQIQQALGGWASIASGALDALAMGLAIGEIVWADEPGTTSAVLDALVWHDPRRFAFHFDAHRTSEIAYVEVVETEQTFPAGRFILYAYQNSWACPLGESDLLAAYQPWLQKNALRQMWLSALDRFGAPTPVARVPLDWSEEDTERLARQLSSLQNESAFVVPANVELSTLESNGSGNGSEPGGAFLAAVDFENREIARAILGQELTTHGGASASGGGSYALGQVHQSVLENWVQAVRADIAERVLTRQIARPLTHALFGPTAPCPRVGWAVAKPGEEKETNP